MTTQVSSNHELQAKATTSVVAQTSAALLFGLLILLLLVIPYIVGAPQIDAPRFQQTDPSVTQALFDLHQQFIVISTAVNLVFWLSLGLCCRFAFNRWFRNIPI